MKDVYMKKNGGERHQAAMYKHNDLLHKNKEKKYVRGGRVDLAISCTSTNIKIWIYIYILI